MGEIVRVLRVLEYVGPREKVEKTLRGSSVKGERTFGKLTIREAVVGTFPEIFTSPQEVCDDVSRKEQTDVGNVVDALLLTDFEDWEMLEREVPKWNDNMRREAYLWAVHEHLSAADNPVNSLECPGHVDALRKLPQKKSFWNTTEG